MSLYKRRVLLPNLYAIIFSIIHSIIFQPPVTQHFIIYFLVYLVADNIIRYKEESQHE